MREPLAALVLHDVDVLKIEPVASAEDGDLLRLLVHTPHQITDLLCPGYEIRNRLAEKRDPQRRKVEPVARIAREKSDLDKRAQQHRGAGQRKLKIARDFGRSERPLELVEQLEDLENAGCRFDQLHHAAPPAAFTYMKNSQAAQCRVDLREARFQRA